MLILGIESSCDDTSVALLDCSEQGHVIISEKTASQIEIHKKYGGVVPEIAGRMHAEKIVPLIEDVMRNHPSPLLRKEGVRPDVIAVTAGPGLITGLIVGVEAARTLSYAWDVPLVAVNHIEGHIYSVEIRNSKHETLNKSRITNSEKHKNSLQSSVFNLRFPALCLVVSGGHTELILMNDHGNYQLLGATKDDAAGECFDKVAKLVGLPYPGGPQISKLAQDGDPNAIPFPRPMIKDKSYDFSFAGLKTAALYWLRDNKLAAAHIQPLKTPAGVFGHIPEPPTINDFCASIEQAIVDVLVTKTLRAAQQYKPASIIVAGGVSANNKLRATLTQQLSELVPYLPAEAGAQEGSLLARRSWSAGGLLTPSIQYCMDNAAMIAIAGFYHAQKKEYTKWQDIKADPNWRLA